jgi:putative spermidine/putrescine transport system substrate-binding protein
VTTYKEELVTFARPRQARIRLHRTVAGIAVAGLLALAAGCGSSGSSTTSSASNPASSAAATAGSSGADSTSAAAADTGTATSAAAFGGLAGLEAAAIAEGKLNLIALPPDWANYGEIIAAFQAKYPGIQIDSQQPDASSAQEITAAQTNKGTDKAPDVFDLGPSVALQNVALFAPYKVAEFDSIPAGNKDPSGAWVNDYTGLMTVGYNATKFGEITSLSQLTDPKFASTVALNGNPTEAGAAFNGVVMAALANGGSPDDISAGVTYFKSLKDAGTFLPLDPTEATVLSGQTGVVFDWSYNQAALTAKLAAEDTEWKSFVPTGAAVGSYYVQAINADAPNPAAARLWQEFLYTPEAQNLWIKGGAKPVLYGAMEKAGQIDPAVAGNLPKAEGTLVTLTDAQTTAANDYLKANWANAVGS